MSICMLVWLVWWSGGGWGCGCGGAAWRAGGLHLASLWLWVKDVAAPTVVGYK